MSAVPAPAQDGRLRSLADFYATTARVANATQFQYRAANYFYMLGMVAEPVIYLVVWSSVARSSGGAVNGITAGQFAAYYIVWTLVRNMNVVFGAPFWEWRIREGELAGQLLRPIHPLHSDLAYFAGWKVVVIALWLPIAAVLTLVFHPDLHPSALEIVVFCIAIWGAYLVRSMFQSTFGFPIESLVGNLSTRSLLLGLAQQALWTAVGFALFRLAWRAAIKRFSAVGG